MPIHSHTANILLEEELSTIEWTMMKGMIGGKYERKIIAVKEMHTHDIKRNPPYNKF